LVTACHSGTKDHRRDTEHRQQDPEDVGSLYSFAKQRARSDEHEQGLNDADHARVDNAGQLDCAEEHSRVPSQKHST
jgi:hypothetical protein